MKGAIGLFKQYAKLKAAKALAREERAKLKAEQLAKRNAAVAFAIVLLVILAILSKDCSPPPTARFLLLLIPKRNREHLIGDLEEEYKTVVLPQFGKFRAGMWYWAQTLWAIGPYLWVAFKKALRWAVIIKLIGG